MGSLKNEDNIRYYPKEYQVGEKVHVKIIDIKEFGALVETMDGHNTRGLIHISNITGNYVEDPIYYFKFGEEIEAEITEWDTEKHQLSLSTKYLNLKPDKDDRPSKLSILAEKLQPLKEKMNAEKEKNYESQYLDKKISSEIQNIINFLNGEIGVVTPRAKEELKKTIEEYGLFQFIMALTRIIDDFEVDYGLILIDKIKKDIEKNTPVTYIASSHSIDEYNNRIKELPNEETEKTIIYGCKHGEILFEYNNVRYMKYGPIFYPCNKIGNEENAWIVKTTMTWDMVEEKLQNKADKYL